MCYDLDMKKSHHGIITQIILKLKLLKFAMRLDLWMNTIIQGNVKSFTWHYRHFQCVANNFF